MDGRGPRNVLYVLFDDLRADFGGGSTSVTTPHLSRLAKEGASFGLAYSQVAFCVPSRASFLTGMRPEATLSIHNDQVERFGNKRLAPLRPGFTVLDAFKRAGYVTAAVGKIFHFAEAHPSLDLPIKPSTHDLLGRPCDSPGAKDVRVPQAHARFGFPKACRLPFGSFVDERVAAAAIGYLRELAKRHEQHEEPFLLLVGFLRPHNPYQFPSQHLDKLPAANATDAAAVRYRHASQPLLAYADSTECTQRKCSREQRRFYRAAVSHADEMLGLVLNELRSKHLIQTTLVVAHSDHGFSLGENGAWQKRMAFDHAARVPLLIRDPTLPHANRGMRIDHAPVELTDVLPTLLDLSGANKVIPPPHHLQGRSLRPLLHGSTGAKSSSFRYAFMIQPRLLYLARPDDKSNASSSTSGRRERQLIVDGGANASDVLGAEGELPRRGKDCSTELVAGGFGPGRACQFVAMGFSVRSSQWRYTRWERWPIRGETKRVWTVGEGQLLAEELYSYSSGNATEQVNLAALGGEEYPEKQALMAALLARRGEPLRT